MKRFLSLVILIPLMLSIALIACEKLREENATKKSNNKVETTKVEEPPSFAGLVEKLKPSVVNIGTTSVVRERSFFSFRSPFVFLLGLFSLPSF